MHAKYWLSITLGILILLPATPWGGKLDLERGFMNPPDQAKPWVYWFWLNGAITREGITADLEAMKRVGIGGVLIMEVNQALGAPGGGTPAGERGLYERPVARVVQVRRLRGGAVGLEKSA